MFVTYFAAETPEKCIATLSQKIHTWVNMLEANSFLELLRMSWAAYHGAFYTDVSNGHQITFSGEQGELANLPVNHFRNIAQHIIVATTSNRPALEARSVNTDYKSLVQTYLANGLLDYYLREKKLEVNLKRAVESAVVLGAGFIKMEWNATTGEIYDYNEDTNTPVYEGDVLFTNISPFDVVLDSTKESASISDHDWVIVRTFRNKFDLAAKYPELADRIRILPTKSEIYRYRLNLMNVQNDTDDVPVYEFYHRRSESMPDGRYLMYLEGNIVLYDGPMPYRTLPVFRLSSGDIMGTPYGYTPMFDILPIQEGINSLYSTILSNQNAFGVQNILVPRGSDINITELVGGLNVIEANLQNGKPEPLNLTQTPAEVFKHLEMLEKAAETISGVSSVSRGDPQASLKSGAALALVQSQTLQFLSGLQQSYVELIESVGTALIDMLKDFAQVPRLAYIVGKSNKAFMKEFKGDDLNSISRVVVDIANPLARTIAGRVQMAEQLVQFGLLKSPQDYLTIMNTGKLEAGTEALQDQLLLIQGENEKLVALEPVRAIAIDDHKMHIEHHRKVLSDPDLRMDEKLVASALAHIQEHIDLLRTTDPGLLTTLNQQPLPPMQPPQGGPQPPNGGPPPQSGPPQSGPPQGQPPGPSNSPASLEGAPPRPKMQPVAEALQPPTAGQLPPRMQGPGIPGQGVLMPHMPTPAAPPPLHQGK